MRYTILQRFSEPRRTALAFTGSLLAVLVLQFGLFAGPAQAHTPTISADASSVTVDEGFSVQNAGSFCTFTAPPFHTHTVSVSASRGSVFQDSSTCGRWNWDYGTSDGPLESGNVTITATTNLGETNSVVFNLQVRNVPPRASFNVPRELLGKDSTFTISLTNPFDQSPADRAAGFTYAFDCGLGLGYGAPSSANTKSCTAGSNPTQTVKGKIIDKDGGTTESVRPVNVDPVAPSTTASATTADGPYTPDTWTNKDVTVNLSATDSGGAGVKEITYSATGAQTIDSTTTPGSSVQIPTITQEGETTITYFATDKVGNTEDSKTLTVKLDKTAPNVDTDNSDGSDGVTPDNGATGVSRLTNVTATFSEGMDPATLTPSTVTLTKAGSTTPVVATVSYDEATKTLTLDPFPDNPTQKLARRATYTAKIEGAKDLAGNPLATTTWSFKTKRR